MELQLSTHAIPQNLPEGLISKKKKDPPREDSAKMKTNYSPTAHP